MHRSHGTWTRPFQVNPVRRQVIARGAVLVVVKEASMTIPVCTSEASKPAPHLRPFSTPGKTPCAGPRPAVKKLPWMLLGAGEAPPHIAEAGGGRAGEIVGV